MDDEIKLNGELDVLLEEIEHNQYKVRSMENYLNIKKSTNKIEVLLNCLLVRSLVSIMLILFFLVMHVVSSLLSANSYNSLTAVGAILFFLQVIVQMSRREVLADLVTIQITIELQKERAENLKKRLNK